MEIAIIGLVLFFLAGGASVLAIGLRNMPQPTIALPVPPRVQVASRPKAAPVVRRDVTFSQERTETIRILLTAGKSPRFIARQLNGSARYNRKRVRAIQEMAKTA